MIYFAKRKLNGHIKIGYSFAIVERLQDLNYQYGEMEIVGVMNGGRKQEKLLHRHFKHLNTHKDGVEFFFFGEELDRYIVDNTRPFTPKEPRLVKGQRKNKQVAVQESTKVGLREFANGLGANYDECIQWMLSRFYGADENPFLVGMEFRQRFMEFKTKPADEVNLPLLPRPVVVPEPVPAPVVISEPTVLDEDTQPLTLPVSLSEISEPMKLPEIKPVVVNATPQPKPGEWRALSDEELRAVFENKRPEYPIPT